MYPKYYYSAIVEDFVAGICSNLLLLGDVNFSSKLRRRISVWVYKVLVELLFPIY